MDSVGATLPGEAECSLSEDLDPELASNSSVGTDDHRISLGSDVGRADKPPICFASRSGRCGIEGGTPAIAEPGTGLHLWTVPCGRNGRSRGIVGALWADRPTPKGIERRNVRKINPKLSAVHLSQPLRGVGALGFCLRFVPGKKFSDHTPNALRSAHQPAPRSRLHSFDKMLVWCFFMKCDSIPSPMTR